MDRPLFNFPLWVLYKSTLKSIPKILCLSFDILCTSVFFFSLVTFCTSSTYSPDQYIHSQITLSRVRNSLLRGRKSHRMSKLEGNPDPASAFDKEALHVCACILRVVTASVQRVAWGNKVGCDQRHKGTRLFFFFSISCLFKSLENFYFSCLW